MAEESIKFSVDGVEIEARKGETILKAAKRSGKKFDLPYYCWHEELSVVAQCRICQVEVEGWPKLVTSCSTPAAKDMKVSTKSEKVQRARAGVMEMYLLNHPLDCPICDKGGECKLQNYTQRYHLAGNHFTHNKIHRPKHKHMGRVVFDAERCIMCTRCTRFDKEVYGDPQIGVMSRAVGLEIDTFDGGDVTHNFSGNFSDLCPVGAWTTSDYRFKARPWQLTEIESTCTTCSNGCSAIYWQMNNHIHRMTSGKHADINRSWICDRGRAGYHIFNDVKKRLTTPLVRSAKGKLAEYSWDEAARVAAEILREAKSPYVLTTNLISNEAANTLKDLARELGSSLNNSESSIIIKNWEAIKNSKLDQRGPAIHYPAKRFLVVGVDLWETTPIFALLAHRRERDTGLIIEKIASVEQISGKEPALLIIGEKEIGDKNFFQKLDDLKKKGVTGILPLFSGCNPRGLIEMGAAPFGEEVQESSLGSKTILFSAADMDYKSALSRRFAEQLANAEKLILLDDVTSPLMETATVVLPTINFAMTYGSISSFDNQPQLMKQVIQPTTSMRSIEEIAALLSAQNFKHRGVAE